MRNPINIIIGYYTDPGYQMETYFQPAYILFLLAELFVFWGFFPDFAILPTFYIGIHLLLLYTLGYQKATWFGHKKKETLYQNIYIASHILLILSVLIADWKLALLCLGIQIGIVVLIFSLDLIAGTMLCDSLNETKIERFIHEFSILFFILIMSIPVIAFVATLFLLHIHLAYQIGILLAMFLLIPFIGELDDEGVNVIEVTFETWS